MHNEKEKNNSGESTEKSQTISTFAELGLNSTLLGILGNLNFITPTPIQKQAIPIAIQGQDVVGIAQTGTGKTLSFGLPMLQRLPQLKARGLVIVPTRELAIQVEESLRMIGGKLGLKTAVIIGGAPMRNQIQNLARNPHVIIATPGRLNDHLQQRTVRLDQVKIVVLDEADRMLDMGFAPQIKTIIQATSKERQTMLFSATMPPEIMKMASAYMKLPIRIEVAPQGTTAELVTQEIYVIPNNAKMRLLEAVLQQYKGTVLAFTRTKYTAQKLTKIMRTIGVNAAEIHSNRSLGQRREALEGFKSGKYRLLLATDIASRGIDVTGIELVINYDLPENTEDYVHRIGRTARAGAGGHAISFASPDQKRDIMAIERLIKKRLDISPLPELPPDRNLGSMHIEDRDERPARSGGGRGGRPPFRGGRSSSGGFGGGRGGSSFGGRGRSSYGGRR